MEYRRWDGELGDGSLEIEWSWPDTGMSYIQSYSSVEQLGHIGPQMPFSGKPRSPGILECNGLQCWFAYKTKVNQCRAEVADKTCSCAEAVSFASPKMRRILSWKRNKLSRSAINFAKPNGQATPRQPVLDTSSKLLFKLLFKLLSSLSSF